MLHVLSVFRGLFLCFSRSGSPVRQQRWVKWEGPGEKDAGVPRRMTGLLHSSPAVPWEASSLAMGLRDQRPQWERCGEAKGGWACHASNVFWKLGGCQWA